MSADALEVVRAVPERDGLAAREPHRALRVAVVERAGKGDDTDAHIASPPDQWVSPAGAPKPSSVTDAASEASSASSTLLTS